MAAFLKKKGKKDTVTAEFTFTFLTLDDSSLKPGKTVQIQWKRGEKKENHGHTPDVEVGARGIAKFNTGVTLKSTLAPEGDKYEPKYMSISVKEVRHFLYLVF